MGYIQGKQIIMPPVYEKLYCVDSLFIIDHHKINEDPVVGSSRDIVYNLRGERLLADSVNTIEVVPHATDNNQLYSIIAPREKSAFIWYNAKEQKIEQVIIKNVSLVYTGGHSDKNFLYLFIYKTGSETPEKTELSFNAQTQKYVLSPPRVVRDEPRLVMDDGMGGAFRSVKNNYVIRNFSFTPNPANVLITIQTRRSKENRVTTNKLTYNMGGGTAELKTFAADEVRQEWYTTRPYNDSEMEKIDTLFEYQNYVKLKKNGKFGFICGRSIIKPVYDTLSFKRIGFKIPHFLVAKRATADGKLKWGLINANNNIIIPCEYDEIITSSGGFLWIVRKGSKYGLISCETGKLRVPVIYNKIVPSSEYAFSFTIMQNNKYGFADDKVFVKPVFDNKFDGWLTFQNYRVLYYKNANDEFYGYADLKGFVYFKN